MDYTQALGGATELNTARVRADGDVYCSIRRYFAYMIDFILVEIGFGVFMYFAGWLKFSSVYITNQLGQPEKVAHVSYTGGAMGYVAGVVLTLGYFVILEWAAGWTIGKMVLGLRVVSLSGDQISISQALIRNVLLLVDALFGCLVALVSMLLSDCRQRVGDRVAGTMVVRW